MPLKPTNSIARALSMMVTVLAAWGLMLNPSAAEDRKKDHPAERGEAELDGVVRFRGRSIDVQRHLSAFPYDRWRWAGSLKHKKLVFLHAGKQQIIAGVDLPVDRGGPVSLDQGRPLCDRDWSTSLSGNWKISERDGAMFLIADENNNEAFNLYRLDPATRRAVKLTDVAYVTDYSFSPDESRVAFIERMGKEGARCRLHVLDIETRRDRVVAEDSDEHGFTWSRISWRPGDGGLVLTTLLRGDRDKGNLAYVPLDGGKAAPRILTDTSVPRTFPETLKHWLSPDEVLITSTESGIRNVYSLHVGTGKQTRLTDLASDVDFAEVTTIGSHRYLVVSVPGPLTTSIHRYNLGENAPTAEKVLEAPEDIRVLDLEGDTLLLKKNSAVLPIRIDALKLGTRMPEQRQLAGLATDVINKVVHSDVESVLFDTFDDIPLTLDGKTHRGKLHGMLYTPKRPLPPEHRLVLVQAMYGGENQFNPDIQILCNAGIHVFSPAPRGSYMFSSNFEQANDGDMGGKEILDLIQAAKYVGKRLGVPPGRIGAFGHSHGGYATLRLLTFPGRVNGITDSFDWGFGICQAGSGSIASNYASTTVKQFIVKEAGDPEKPGVRARWEDRSPINHVDHLRGRLLIIHGTADERVPFADGKRMYDRLVEAGKGKQVRFLPIAGAGHFYTSDSDRLRIARETFTFLEEVP